MSPLFPLPRRRLACVVVVMQPGASAEDVGDVVARVEAAGGEAFVSRGVTRTIIGLVGDIEHVRRAEPARACPASPT